jgi:ribosomal protein S18 acetylase RimI-like enzyme
MRIRGFRHNDLNGVKKITKELHPKWFDKKALKNIPIDVRLHKCIVVEDKGIIIGFISFYSQKDEARIGWIGVKPDLRRKGIGTKLLAKVEKELKIIGAKAMRVETVGETNPQYKPYKETVKFYQTCGFEVEKKLKPGEEKGYKYRMYVLKKVLH